MNFKYKNSTKNNFAVDILLVLIAAVLTFMGAKIFGAKISVVVYALAIAVCFYKIAVEAIEKLINGKIHATLIYLVSVLVIFASQKFLMSAIVAILYSLSTAIFEAINCFISKKVLEDDENKLRYAVLVDGKEEKSVLADELKTDDVVKVKKGDYLAFDYLFTNAKGEEKVFNSGKFIGGATEDEVLVKVVNPASYDVDFAESEKDKNSKVFKIVTLVTKVYTLLMIVAAFVLFILDYVQSKAILQSLYVLGVYLIFANPLVVESGVFVAGLLSLKELKKNGLKLKNVSALEKISTVKKVFFTNDLAVKSETKVNPEMIKAVKIADVLGVETELLSDVDDKKTQAIAKTIGFKNYQSDVSGESVNTIVDAPMKSGVSAYVTSKEVELEKSIVISTEKSAVNGVCKNRIGEVIKAINYSKVFKWFSYARITVGAFVNTVVLAVFASGKGAQILANKLVETDATTFKGKLLTSLVQYEMLTPWIICVLQLVVINLLLFVALAFLNDDKKLR